MPEQKEKRPIFIGWWSVLFIGVISGLGHGFNTYGISVFFKPIAAELVMNRTYTSLAAGIGRLEGGITSPLVGWLADRFGPRWLAVGGIMTTATGMILMYFIREPWHYYLAWGGLIGFGLNIGLTVVVDKSINDWFLRKRGLAQGIKFALVGVFGVVVLQIINPLIELQGWRVTCLIWGFIMFASVPFAYFLIKPHRPEHYGLLPDGARAEPYSYSGEGEKKRAAAAPPKLQEPDYTFRQALKTSTFWMLVIGFSAHNFIAGGFNVHVFPFLTDTGMTGSAAGGLMGMMVFFTIPSRFFGGIIADRVAKNRLNLLLMSAFLLQAVGTSTYLVFQNTPATYVLLIGHGLSSGAVTPLIILLLGRYFGRKAFGSILGMLVLFLAPMGLVSPMFYGWVFDTTASYNNAFITALALASLAFIAMFFLRAPRVNPLAPKTEWQA